MTVKGVSVSSGVSEQPFDMETYEGAKNRAEALFNLSENADFYVGIEGGIQRIGDVLFGFGAVAILNNQKKIAYGTSPQYEIPKKIFNMLQSGKELGEVIDILSGEEDSKHKGGAVGFFTKGIFNRKDLYVTGVLVALIPFLNIGIFFNEE